mmetsp:Transcript_24747/g.34567  ORF Transcript_24747/g.34567 Transcript_24747/m.34567 type:complete len:94 (-) Transcript_24747:85-366(-)
MHHHGFSTQSLSHTWNGMGGRNSRFLKGIPTDGSSVAFNFAETNRDLNSGNTTMSTPSQFLVYRGSKRTLRDLRLITFFCGGLNPIQEHGPSH